MVDCVAKNGAIELVNPFGFNAGSSSRKQRISDNRIISILWAGRSPEGPAWGPTSEKLDRLQAGLKSLV